MESQYESQEPDMWRKCALQGTTLSNYMQGNNRDYSIPLQSHQLHNHAPVEQKRVVNGSSPSQSFLNPFLALTRKPDTAWYCLKFCKNWSGRL